MRHTLKKTPSLFGARLKMVGVLDQTGNAAFTVVVVLGF
jgi:hypothetical protein